MADWRAGLDEATAHCARTRAALRAWSSARGDAQVAEALTVRRMLGRLGGLLEELGAGSAASRACTARSRLRQTPRWSTQCSRAR